MQCVWPFNYTMPLNTCSPRRTEVIHKTIRGGGMDLGWKKGVKKGGPHAGVVVGEKTIATYRVRTAGAWTRRRARTRATTAGRRTRAISCSRRQNGEKPINARLSYSEHTRPLWTVSRGIAARLRQYSARAVGARAGDRLRVGRRRKTASAPNDNNNYARRAALSTAAGHVRSVRGVTSPRCRANHYCYCFPRGQGPAGLYRAINRPPVSAIKSRRNNKSVGGSRISFEPKKIVTRNSKA